MELYDLVLLGLLSTFVSAIISIISVVIAFSFRSRDVNDLYRKVESLEMSIRGQLSGNARAEAKAQEEAFMVQAAAILKGEGSMQEKIQKVIATDPGMAMKLAKKLGIGL